MIESLTYSCLYKTENRKKYIIYILIYIQTNTIILHCTYNIIQYIIT